MQRIYPGPDWREKYGPGRILGRCHGCGSAYIWKARKGRRLKDRFPCPKCGTPLSQTTIAYGRGPWYHLDPED